MTKLKCKKCGQEWDTKSDRMYVTCPNCLTKVKNTIKEKKVN